MKFTAKKFMSLVFAASLAGTGVPSLSVLGNPPEGNNRGIELVAFRNGEATWRLSGAEVGPDRRWCVTVFSEYLLNSVAVDDMQEAKGVLGDPDEPDDDDGTVGVYPPFSFEAVPNGPDALIFRKFERENCPEKHAIGAPGAPLDIWLTADVRPGHFGAVPQFEVDVQLLNNHRSWTMGKFTDDSVLDDSVEDASASLDVTIEAHLTGEVEPATGQPQLRVVVLDPNDLHYVVQTWTLTPNGHYDREQLRALEDQTRRRIDYRRLDHPLVPVETDLEQEHVGADQGR
jgi:hypothetical protein